MPDGRVGAGTGARWRNLKPCAAGGWSDRAVVVKQSLPMLRVEEVWEFDPRRILVECDCMRILGDLLPRVGAGGLDVDEHRSRVHDDAARRPAEWSGRTRC